APRRLQCREDVPHLRVVEVDAGDGEAARRRLRFLDDLDDAIAVHAGDAEMLQVLVLLDAREDDARARALAREVLDDRAERTLEDVVCEEHADLVAADEA